MKSLTLYIKGEFFKQIVEGRKVSEFREIKPFYTRRLVGKQYDVVTLINGYAARAPRAVLTYLGYEEIERVWSGETIAKPTYAIQLGELISVENYLYDILKNNLCQADLKTLMAATAKNSQQTGSQPTGAESP